MFGILIPSPYIPSSQSQSDPERCADQTGAYHRRRSHLGETLEAIQRTKHHTNPDNHSHDYISKAKDAGRHSHAVDHSPTSSDTALDEGNQPFGVAVPPLKLTGANHHPPHIVCSRQNGRQGTCGTPLSV